MSRSAASWAFHHHFHMDKANAAVHTSETRFSPLTFRLAESLTEDERCMHVQQVLNDKGSYPEDIGRVEMDPR